MLNIFRSFFSTARSSSPAAMSQAGAKVQAAIKNSAVVLFSKSYCPYCHATKRTLDALNAKYELMELDKMPDGSALQDSLEEISGQRTVPNVYIKQKHIGGNSNIQELQSAGKLEPLLKEAGAIQE
ncbi:hypothetical protein E4U32_000437 [Claviceps aff. humidiphila group G2b]|nr:hypothetical protein E4U32_000437 [Claviceps aff. humidiphila group G2b]